MLVFYNENNEVTGYQIFPDTSPRDHIKVEDEALIERIKRGYNFAYVEDGVVVVPPDEDIENIIKQKEFDAFLGEVELIIDTAANKARLRYISPNKDATYQQKSKEVDRWVADGKPEEFEVGVYPYIEAEAAYTGMTTTEVGDLIIAMRDQWIQVDSLIEGVSRGGKVSVLKAETLEEAQEILQACIAQLDAI